jgi:predicted nucleic acid-binding protein
VPLLLENHAFHPATLSECERLRRQQVRFVISVHALLECFSVLTRMPPPYRRPPEEARRLLDENFAADAEVSGLASEAAWSAIREFAAAGGMGGAIYDAVIARSALAAGATVLLTWNVRDFLPVAPAGLEIVTPPEHSARGAPSRR